MDKKGLIANLIGAFVVLLIGLYLYKPIKEQMNIAINQTQNVSSGSFVLSNAFIELVPGLFAVIIIGFAIILAWKALSGSDLSESDSDDEEKEEKAYKEHSSSSGSLRNTAATVEEEKQLTSEEIKQKEKELNKSKYD